MSLHSVFSSCLLPLNSTSQPALAADCLSLAEYALRTHPAHSSLFFGTCGLCCRFVLTTLARLPFRLGLGREWTPWLSSGLLVHLFSCPYSDTNSLSAVIWIFVLYLFVSWLVGVVVVIYMFFGIYCNYCDVTICEIHPHCVHVLRACDVWWAFFPSVLCGVWRESLKLHRLDWRASQGGWLHSIHAQIYP